MTAVLEVVDGGLLTTMQDAGRPGFAHLGVPPSGYLDVPAARLANRLVGNHEDAALLETTGSGPTMLLRGGGLVVAVTGAPASLRVDGQAVDHHASFLLRDTQSLSVGRATSGLRSYIAVRGGFVVEPVLGSRSTDLLSGLGPPVLQAGQRLPVGDVVGDMVGDVVAGAVPSADGMAFPSVLVEPVIRLDPGPSGDWFTPEALQLLGSQAWTVDPASSRVGLRLTGPPLARRRSGELAPEGMVTGSLQVPPSGLPVLLLADHPTTGGYPVIAVAAAADLRHAAQAAPGTTVRFRLRANPGQPRTYP
ncbi:MAG TPA: biotin-dependent carboxyltransferase family protein [Frankiaceae bacterium]|nr:biotin-dependent carboxyltransferase family protein [Frankiaceae bacterium]